MQLPVLLLTVGSGALVGMELVGSMMLGWYAGALYGFALGSMQILKTTVDFSGDILAKGDMHSRRQNTSWGIAMHISFLFPQEGTVPTPALEP